MNTQTEAQRLAAKMKSYKLASGYAWHCHKAGDELLRLDKIEAEWAALSQDDGKAQRKIERLEAANAELLEALKGTTQELLDVLKDINNDRIPFDGDEFHERLEAGKAAIAKHGGAA